MPDFAIKALKSSDAEWVKQFIIANWGADIVIAHGIVYQPQLLPGFAAFDSGQIVGLLTYNIEGDSCEIITLDSLQEAKGIGTALIEAVKEAAREAGCRRLWLITTNDNLHALRFYQKRGFVLVAVHRNAVEVARQIKPQIPLIGNDGIPLRDEIELEISL